MAYAKILEKDAVLLVRALGLLVNQASVYGPTHKVTRMAAGSVFSELARMVAAYGTVEIVANEKEVLVNGSAEGIGPVVGKNLSDRMALHKIGGIVFLSPSDLNEFLTCVSLFGSQPFALAADGGFEGAVKKAKLRSIQVVTVAFQRVVGDSPAEPPPPVPEPEPKAHPAPSEAQGRPAVRGGVGVLDLSSDLSMDEDAEEKPHKDTARDDRERRASSLAALLRETASLLEQSGAQTTDMRHQAVVAALEQIRRVLTTMTADSETHIATLANELDDDRQTIASIESAARRRGIGLKLMRAELVQRYAELNQEIIQPLTVSSGVIDMLNSGCTGSLTESQRELLKMAAESVSRVNQLVAYMSRISGLPESYTPDAAIIQETYR